MNKILDELVKKLHKSPTSLNSKNIKKIQRYIPVPTDYKIIWADITNFGGSPSGIVITDKALIVKSSKSEAKKYKQRVKKENKGNHTKIKTPNTIYQIIPWEYYSPEDYEIKIIKEKNGNKKFVLIAGDLELAQFNDKDFYNLMISYKQEILEARQAADSTFSAISTINTEGVMFNAAYGADQTKTGHGIYAEEAGAKLDKLSGEKVSVVGRDNAKNGPDKIVDSVPIQCKYYKNASGSVNACFKVNPSTGMKEFRYYDLNGNAMKIEVPSDQYLDSIRLMKKRIANGEVPGVTDVNAAFDIIKKGKLTYKQALNLAKAGTIESIGYDVVNGAVTCLSAFGISSVVAFAQVFWVTKDYKKAAKSALFTGLQVYGLSFVGGVISSQISRTGFIKLLSPLTDGVTKMLSPKMTQEIINAFRAIAGKKAVYGAAAQKSFSKFIGATAISQTIMCVVFSIPDTYKMIKGRISGSQYIKNMSSLALSFIGTIAGSAAAGAIIGENFGESLDKKVVSGVSMVVGAVVGAACGGTAKCVGDLVHEDDAVITTRMFNSILSNQIINYMLSEEEIDIVISLINEDEKELRNLQQNLLKSKFQEQDVIKYLEPKILKVIDNRKHITNKDEEKLEESIPGLVLEGGISYAM